MQRDPRLSRPQEKRYLQPWAVLWLEQPWNREDLGFVIVWLFRLSDDILMYNHGIQEFLLATCTIELDWCSLLHTCSLSQCIFNSFPYTQLVSFKNAGRTSLNIKAAYSCLTDGAMILHMWSQSCLGKSYRMCPGGAERLTVISISAGHALRIINAWKLSKDLSWEINLLCHCESMMLNFLVLNYVQTSSKLVKLYV